jgi:dTDP-4-amino-4,6-dideoxygalactose transaminase
MPQPMKTSPTPQFMPFALPEIGEEEIASVVECMRSNWLTSGPRVREFEKKFTDFIGADVEAVSINSATAGLTIALEALGVGFGDEVITTAYTFSASAMSAVYLGATPVLVDIDPVTMNMDANLIEAAITPRTKAIIPVHFAGLACDMDAIISIAKKYNLKIVEDAAHALPCKYKGKMIGSLETDATVYSFYATKTITTGEGGMLVTRNPEIAKRARIMRLHGISTDAFDRYTSTKPKWFYEITAPGYKCNMTDIAAAIGIPQLARANDFQRKRSYIRQKYVAAFADLPIILPVENCCISGFMCDGAACAKNHSPCIHSHHLFVIRLTEAAKINRDDFIARISAEYGIGCSVHFIPLNLHPFWQEKLGVNAEDFPHAVKAYKNAVSLPIYTKMTDGDIQRVIVAVQEILE